jgi:putative radical SAM enzyme (TIGR03279 family)
MSELIVKNPPNALIVSSVDPGSPAERAGIRAGDLIREINGRRILDILDYQFHSAESLLQFEVDRAGDIGRLTLRKDEDEVPGLTFLHDLGDKIHTCNNKCVFCFIHQMPKKMRKTLYLMDDDFRLSFMHGNYVTLTNITDAEFQRIIDQKLSPLYVSVHATDPELRGVLLGKKEPAPILPQIRVLADKRIDVHAQIVLCPGLNDGERLKRTLDDLAAEHRSQTGKRAGVDSVAIVPVGLTRFRERLPNLASADREYAARMIYSVRQMSNGFRKCLGTRFAWLSDEWYFLAGLPIPGKAHYEEFPQLEDGIGTVRLFLESAKSIDRKLPGAALHPVSATLVTAELPSKTIQSFADRLNRIEGVDINVCVVKNDFFGGGINIAGLLTAQDILSNLSSFPVKQTVVIPSVCLRDGNVFLDDYTVDDMRRESGFEIRVSGNSPEALVALLGLLPDTGKRPRTAHSWLMEESPA